MADKYQCLKLDNQLCFPLYAVSKEIVRKYKPFLDEVDLTYTQYIVMMVVWEDEQVSVKEMGKKLYLDSGTLTPVLKTLEKKGLIERTRSKEDERNLIVTLTPSGKALKDKAVDIPAKMGGCLNISPEDAMELHNILHRIMETL
ncbi:MAG: MarR family transcriptional regulator [Lachnospiraceae bacterium]|nr:MarR family transcriptional regulator [Lachnospiraceae bacterium]MBQ4300357.1 MarR family transcriptional regulator [Lachnospiraceae bacterium]